MTSPQPTEPMPTPLTVAALKLEQDTVTQAKMWVAGTSLRFAEFTRGLERELQQAAQRIGELEAHLDTAAAALADIAFSDDLSEWARRNKAKRAYEVVRAKQLAEEKAEAAALAGARAHSTQER